MTRPVTNSEAGAPIHPERARHFAVIRARLARYQAFERFLGDAPTRLPRLYATLGVGSFYRDYYSLCITPGGAQGAQDPRTLEVFFGQRPFDVAFVPSDQPRAQAPFAPPPAPRTVAERGARLLYTRTDHGRLLCLLRPATTEFTSPLESEILLGEVDPQDLESPPVLMRHLRWLLAYMAATSLDGVAFSGQRWRYLVLHYFRRWRKAESGKWHPSRALKWTKKVATWVLTVALSGWLLYVIQRKWPLPDSVTPAVQQAAKDAHDDQIALRGALAPARAAGHALGPAAAATTSPPPGVTSHVR